MKKALEHWRGFVLRYVEFARRHPYQMLAIFLAFSVVGIWLAATGITVETDLAALLPENTPSVKALEMSETRIGSIDFFTIALESKAGDTEAIVTMQDRLKARIEAEWKDAQWVQVERDTTFFKEHALYYLKTKDLEDLLDRLDYEFTTTVAEKVPGLVNFLDDGDGTEGLDHWYKEEIVKGLGFPPRVERAFNEFFKEKDKSAPVDTPETKKLPSKYADRLISEEGNIGVVLVQLDKPSMDIDFTREAMARGEALIADLYPESLDPTMKVEVVGAYRKFKEVDAISRDGKLATIISVVLVLLLILLFFRSFRMIAVVFFPLIVAASVTMGVVALTFGRLTVLTVFILALLVGMGIDYGIHLYGRILHDVRRGMDLPAACRNSLFSTGQALLMAALTTIASLMTLMFGHFQGFREFGIAASYGLVFCVLSSILVIPPMLFMLQRWKPIRILPHAKNAEMDATVEERPSAMRSWLRRLFVFGGVMTLGFGGFAPQVIFEYDIRNLTANETHTQIDYHLALGKDASTTPGVMLGSSREQMKKVHDCLLKRLVEEHDPTLTSFLTYYTFVPAKEDQQERKEIIDEIGDIVHTRAMQKLTGEKKRLVEELTTMVDAQPFDHTDLPAWARRIVTEADGSVGKIGHLYALIDNWNVYSGQEFFERYADFHLDGEWIPVANSRFILSDVVTMVKKDGLRLLVLVSLALVMILFMFTRKISGTFVLFGVLAVSSVWTAGVMGLANIRLSLYNIIVIPVILGVGIDGAIHLYHRYLDPRSKGLTETLRTTGVTVTASSWTTMAGFMGLLFVEHKGLRTIGTLGTIGVALSWFGVMILLPFLLDRYIRPRKSAKVEEDRTKAA